MQKTVWSYQHSMRTLHHFSNNIDFHTVLHTFPIELTKRLCKIIYNIHPVSKVELILLHKPNSETYQWWSSRPLDKGGMVFKKIFLALRGSVWSRNKGGTLPYICHCLHYTLRLKKYNRHLTLSSTQPPFTVSLEF